MAIFIFFIILQIADGFFTLYGINAVGIDNYESTPLLVFYMHRFGAAETLFAAKTLAILLGYILYRYKVLNALFFLNGFYSCALYSHYIYHQSLSG